MSLIAAAFFILFLFHGRAESVTNVVAEAHLFPAPGSVCRSAFEWPFSSQSVWNTPIGAGALFSPANLFSPGRTPINFVRIDQVYIVNASARDPLVPWYNQGHWGKPRDEAHYCNITGPLVTHLHFPADLNFSRYGENACSGLLQPDGRTLLTPHPLYVCSPGGPILALQGPPGQQQADIFSDTGNLGGFGGSGLSAVGPAIRMGQMLPSAPPISHALAMELYGHNYYFRPPTGNFSQCFRWPAVQCDGDFDCVHTPLTCYNGTNALLTPGALLAVPPAAYQRLKATLQTVPARRLLEALAGYGAYIVADSCGDVNFVGELGMQDEFLKAYGFDFNVLVEPVLSPWASDLIDLLRALEIVANNNPSTPGGGGTPGRPPPPPFCTSPLN
jgi:hypothetical protein